MGWFRLAVGSHENLPRVNHQSETKSIDIETETTSLKNIGTPHENSHLPQKRDRTFYIQGKYHHLPTIHFPRKIFLRFAGCFSCTGQHRCLGRFYPPDPRRKGIADIIFDARKSGPRGPRRHGIAEGNLEKKAKPNTKLLENMGKYHFC